MSCGITNIGAKLYISTTAENDDLDLSGFAGLAYNEIPNVGNIGDSGISQNTVSYSLWDRLTVCKGKGEASGADFTVELMDTADTGTGTTAFLAAAEIDEENAYAFKIEWKDGSVEYNRGLVTGPMRLKGANEDFKRLQFIIATQQAPIAVGPTP